MEGGSIFHCCPTWLPHPVANITEVSILEAYAGSLSSDVRREVQSGSFQYCEAKLCPYLSRYVNLGELRAPIHPRAEVARVNREHSVLQRKRLMVMLNYDPSCNLRCGSCRNETILFREEDAPPRLREVHEAVTRNLRELRNAGYEMILNVTGSGDAFASPLYSRLLRELEYDPRLRLELQTNGVLMEEARFTEPMYRMLEFLAVSVDAATQPTYERVRRGGNFARLRRNLDWIDDALRAKRFGRDVYYKINFIVQRDNFREMPEFARWMLGYESVSEVWFNLIADWGHLPKEEFARKAIWMPEHPEHGEFRQVMKDPILRSPRVHLGNVSAYL